MSRWFRHYAGMMRDDKLVGVAIRSKQSVERVIWVWGAILESAAEKDDGGRFDLDCAEVAYFLRADEADIQCIVECLRGSGRISGDCVARWCDRQFQSDRSAERQKRHRERKSKRSSDDDNKDSDGRVTSLSRHGDAPETETETETETEAFSSEKAARTREADFRSEVMACFRQAGQLSADTGRAAVWLANGWKPEICIAVLREILERKPGASLNYAEPAIRQAHEAQRSGTGPPVAKPAKFSALRYAAEMYGKSNERHHDSKIIDVSPVASEGGGWPDADGRQHRSGRAGGDYPGSAGPVARAAGVSR